MKQESPQTDAPHPPFSMQARMVVVSYFGYFFYYLTRKHLGVATHSMVQGGYSEDVIAWTQTGYGLFYAIGQFMSGALGDRIGPRIAICVGMILSALSSMAFGIFPFVGVLVIGMSLNGLFQSTGWPNEIKIVSQWVGYRVRGRVMGVWLTCYTAGSLAANSIAGFVLEHYGMREMFLVTGVVVAVVGVIQGIFLINRPEDLGYAIPRREAPKPSADGKPVLADGFAKMIRNPSVLILGFTYFGLKFVRYALFAWLPYYLATVVKLDDGTAANISNGFELGGVIGLILGGIAGDRWFRGNRSRLAFLSLVGLVGSLCAFQAVSSHGGAWVNFAALGAIGCFLYVADSIISGVAAQDIGGAGSTASAAGIINGIGSLAQPLAGVVPIYLKNLWGWDAVFFCFVGLAIASCFILVPVARKRELAKA